MTTKSAQIVGLTGELAGKAFPVGDALLIGRVEGAGVQLANLEVSRRHCQIERSDDGFRVVDLGSRSGTRLNDAPVQSAPVESGDLITVGPHVFRVEILAEEATGITGHPMTMAIDNPEAQLMLKEIQVSDYKIADQISRDTALEDLDRLRHHLLVVHEFSQAIQTTLDTNVLIERTLDELFRVFGKMDAGVLFLRDPGTTQLAPAAIRRRRKTDTGPVGYSTTILRSVESEQKAVVLLDVSQDERFQDALSVKMGSMRTHMCVPLVVPGEVMGAIYLVAEGQDESAEGFDAEDLALLASLSGTVAVCVKNASLAREAQRNAQLNSNLQRYVSPEVTRRIIEQGVHGAFGARTTDGVVMFCDLVGFTTLSEQLAPERMAKILNRYFRRALDIVFRHQGSVNKFGGDSFLAVWGAIEGSPADLICAVRSALEIQNDTFRLAAELAAEGIGSIQLTIGLNRGRFFAGDIGSEERMEFTVIGDAVNVAARIQALAHPSQVLTSLDSLGDSRSRMSLVLYPDTPIRGRDADVTVASVRSLLLTPGDGQSTPHQASPAGAASDDDSVNQLQHEQSPAQRLLASIPLEIPELNSRAIVIGARLGQEVELDLLAGRAPGIQQALHLSCAAPELVSKHEPTEALCLAAMADGPVQRLRVRLATNAGELVELLTPGGGRIATGTLRAKT